MTQTKFEEFIARLHGTFRDLEVISQLLKAYFACEHGGFTANFPAIASLLSCGRALACLTTNFDNAIEMAIPDLQRFVHPQRPDDLDVGSMLIKLHGTAEGDSPSFLASTQALYVAEQNRWHEYLHKLLAGRRILVLAARV